MNYSFHNTPRAPGLAPAAQVEQGNLLPVLRTERPGFYEMRLRLCFSHLLPPEQSRLQAKPGDGEITWSSHTHMHALRRVGGRVAGCQMEETESLKGQLPEGRILGCLGALGNLAPALCSLNVCWSHQQADGTSCPCLPFHCVLSHCSASSYPKGLYLSVQPPGLCTPLFPSPWSTFSLLVGVSAEICVCRDRTEPGTDQGALNME